MKFASFIAFYQYFDSLETNLHYKYLELCKKSVENLTLDELKELEYTLIKLDFVRFIFREFLQYFTDFDTK